MVVSRMTRDSKTQSASTRMTATSSANIGSDIVPLRMRMANSGSRLLTAGPAGEWRRARVLGASPPGSQLVQAVLHTSPRTCVDHRPAVPVVPRLVRVADCEDYSAKRHCRIAGGTECARSSVSRRVIAELVRPQPSSVDLVEGVGGLEVVSSRIVGPLPSVCSPTEIGRVPPKRRGVSFEERCDFTTGDEPRFIKVGSSSRLQVTDARLRSRALEPVELEQI